mmetsp:Transcript_23723/g.29462  ORF Transcript_23723/g.29462 Transcript_23723/m.29462 type:complete len:254 (-) Transcript_23723:477-1238(-)
MQDYRWEDLQQGGWPQVRDESYKLAGTTETTLPARLVRVRRRAGRDWRRPRHPIKNGEEFGLAKCYLLCLLHEGDGGSEAHVGLASGLLVGNRLDASQKVSGRSAPNLAALFVVARKLLFENVMQRFSLHVFAVPQQPAAHFDQEAVDKWPLGDREPLQVGLCLRLGVCDVLQHAAMIKDELPRGLFTRLVRMLRGDPLRLRQMLPAGRVDEPPQGTPLGVGLAQFVADGEEGAARLLAHIGLTAFKLFCIIL